jgi:hypothetical protein
MIVTSDTTTLVFIVYGVDPAFQPSLQGVHRAFLGGVPPDPPGSLRSGLRMRPFV